MNDVQGPGTTASRGSCGRSREDRAIKSPRPDDSLGDAPPETVDRETASKVAAVARTGGIDVQPIPINTPLSTDAGRLARIAEVIADVSNRLRGVCRHFPDDEFEALVRNIAEIAVKYEAMAEMQAARPSKRD